MPRNKSSKTNSNSNSNDDEKSELIHARKVISAHLSRFSQFLKIQEDIENILDVDVFQIESRLKIVEEDMSKFNRIQTRLEYLVPDEDDQGLHLETLFYSEISLAKKIISCFNKSQQEIIENKVNFNSSRTQQGTQGSAVARLPHLGLPTFFGNYESWFSFIDIFDSIVNNRTDLSDVDKFLYLRLSCKGDALKLIESLDVTASNYSVAIELLRKRYENRRAIINTHVNNILFNLPTITRESAFHLRKLLDTLHQHLSALEKLRLPVDQWDIILIPIILQKLDDKTKRDWESKQNDQSLPKLKDFTEFLRKKCFMLEAIQDNDIQKPSLKNQNFRETSRQNSNSRKLSYASVDLKCPVCKESHYVYQCKRFNSLSLADKYNEIRNHKLCGNCLRSGHFKNDCHSQGCKKCNFKHNTALHVDRQNSRTFEQQNRSSNNVPHNPSNNRSQVRQQTDGPGSPTSQRNEQANFGEENVRHTMCIVDRNTDRIETDLNNKNITENSNVGNSYSYTSVDSSQVLLSTAKILIQNSDNKWITCNAILDSASQSNLISENLFKILKLGYDNVNISLLGIGHSETHIVKRMHTKIKSRFENFERKLTFLIKPGYVTERLPTAQFNKSSFRYPNNIQLADENFNVPKEIDVLLGAGIFFDLVKYGKIRLGNNLPILQATYLGWVIAGNLNVENHIVNDKPICNFVSEVTNQDLDKSLTKFWQIEELENKKHLSKDEKYCEEYFKMTTRRNSVGQFIVKYPFRQNLNYQLGNSKKCALKRFYNLETRFKKNENFKDLYTKFIHEYEDLDHMQFNCYLEDDKSIERNRSFTSQCGNKRLNYYTV
ncbi:uncharacterized protein LOC115887601 [Sitophilus oryzae]|uniref:Uncharacterized protein LOC115887601 n=1 Tax=Sitophilus oryzae TaxID=7048 RepID=A0A6J2YJ85_SITOR|nr:uncharacterized protein LOC115887601 [Sitophilus oryzae]